MRRACGVLCVLLAVVAAATASAQPTASEFNAAGVEQYNAKQYVSAIASFKKAYDLAPDNATVKRNLSNAYQAQANESAKNNDLDAAIETLGLAIGVDPGNALPLTQLGFYCLRKDLVADAAFRLEEAGLLTRILSDQGDQTPRVGTIAATDSSVLSDETRGKVPPFPAGAEASTRAGPHADPRRVSPPFNAA